MTSRLITPLGGAKPLMAGTALGYPTPTSPGLASNFGPGTHSFTPTSAGVWKFIGWGPGGGSVAGTTSGASGGYVEYSKRLTTVDAVTIVVGRQGTNTTITFPNGFVVTAGSGASAVAGTATNGDVNLAGTAGTDGSTGISNPGGGTGGGAGGSGSISADGGAGAPANLPYRGGIGGTGNGTATTAQGSTPGAGAGLHPTLGFVGGHGFVLAIFQG